MRHIAIIGLGDGMNDAPRDVERWGLPWGGDSGLDMYFEMHDKTVRPFTDGYKNKLAELDVPVLMQKSMEGVPNSLTYPKEAKEMMDNYIESSTGYMLAYAIYLDIDVIELHGIGAPFDSHYVHQRANLEFMIGFALSRGIQIQINDKSELMTSNWGAGIYGFDQNNLRPGTEYVH